MPAGQDVIHSTLTNDSTDTTKHQLHSPGYVKASAVEMNAITNAWDGDICFRTDIKEYFIFYSGSFHPFSSASSILFDPAGTIYTSTTVQGALEETSNLFTGAKSLSGYNFLFTGGYHVFDSTNIAWYGLGTFQASNTQLIWENQTFDTQLIVNNIHLLWHDILSSLEASDSHLFWNDALTTFEINDTHVFWFNGTDHFIASDTQLNWGAGSTSVIANNSQFRWSNGPVTLQVGDNDFFWGDATASFQVTDSQMLWLSGSDRLSASHGQLFWQNGTSQFLVEDSEVYWNNGPDTLEVSHSEFHWSNGDETLEASGGQLQYVKNSTGVTFYASEFQFYWKDATSPLNEFLISSSESHILTAGNLTILTPIITTGAAIIRRTQSITNRPTGGNIGTAATTVDIDASFNVNQTTAAQTITIPSPTVTTAGRTVFINNVGSTSFTMLGKVLPAGAGLIAMWNGTAWSLVGFGG